MPNLLIRNLPFLIPLLALSGWVVYIIVERLLFFKKRLDKQGLDITALFEALKHGKVASVEHHIKEKRYPAAELVCSGIAMMKRRDPAIEYELDAQAVTIVSGLETNVHRLSGFANLSTLLGLLGTVTGMIIAFISLQIEGISDPAVVAGGISQALITTAAGLFVAIPALFAFYFFTAKIKEQVHELDRTMSHILGLHKRLLSRLRENPDE